MKIRKVKTKSLITWLIVILIFSMIMGVTAGAMGFGSLYPQLNLTAKPFVCPNQEMTYAQNVSHIGSETYWTATWFCGDEEIDSNTIFMFAGPVYGLVFFAVFLIIIYWYWYSSVGPAKNDGLELW